MIRRIIIAILLYVEDLISRWAERREIERTSDAQAENDARDRGPSDDVRDRMWRKAGVEPQRAERERNPRGGMPPANDRGGDDKGG